MLTMASNGINTELLYNIGRSYATPEEGMRPGLANKLAASCTEIATAAVLPTVFVVALFDRFAHRYARKSTA
jgi:hypothetical protein